MNPNIPQGTLNKLRASLTFTDFPELNVTPSFTGRDGISLAFDGPSSTVYPTMTGVVPSPEPYIECTLTLHLLKTQSLADAYKSRVEGNPVVGDVVMRPDAATLSDYSIKSCSIVGMREVSANGSDAGYVVMIRGAYQISNNLWGG